MLISKNNDYMLVRFKLNKVKIIMEMMSNGIGLIESVDSERVLIVLKDIRMVEIKGIKRKGMRIAGFIYSIRRGKGNIALN